MSYNGKNPFKIPRPVMFVGGVDQLTLAGNVTIDRTYGQLLDVDPDGADRTMTLPAEEDNDGLWYVIRNAGSAGEELQINNDAAASVVLLPAGAWAWIGCDGKAATPAWKVFGSSAVATTIVPDDVALTFGNDGDWTFEYDENGTNQMRMTGSATGWVLQGGAASTVNTTAANLTLSTTTSGTLAMTSAGTLDLDGVAVTIDSSGAMTLTAADGQVLSLVAGDGTASVAISAVGAVDLTSESGQAITLTGTAGGVNVTAGAASTWTNTDGDWVVDNTSVTGSSIFVLGTDTSAVDFQVQNNSATALLKVTPTSATGGTTEAVGLQAVQTTAGAITGATALTLADSGGVFSVDQSAAYDIDLPDPTSGPGCEYTFYLTAPGAFNVTLTSLGGATFVGTIVNGGISVIPATGSTLTFASSTAALGDTIVIKSISTSLYLVQAVTTASGGITVA